MAASAGSPAQRLGSPMHFAQREPHARPIFAVLGRYLAELAILLAIGAGFGWMGPFGTFGALGTPERFAYWLLSMPLVGVPASLAMNTTMRSPVLARFPWPARILLGAAIAAVPGVLIVRALSDLFAIQLGGSFATFTGAFVSVAVVIAVVGLCVTSLTGRHHYAAPVAHGAAMQAAPPLAPRPAASPFLDRIPPRLGRTLRRIETEDHYLRVHTDLGHDLVLFRLADALAELDPALGEQVHRSHWVARAAVAGIERDGPRTTLRLVDGARVPVSRTFLPALRKAGWL